MYIASTAVIVYFRILLIYVFIYLEEEFSYICIIYCKLLIIGYWPIHFGGKYCTKFLLASRIEKNVCPSSV